MSKIDVQLGDSGDNAAVFHNLRYTNDGYDGNKNEMTFEIVNWSGNMIDAAVGSYATDEQTGKTRLVWGADDSFDAIRLTIRGSCENSEFLQMLRLILEAEKIVEIIKP